LVGSHTIHTGQSTTQQLVSLIGEDELMVLGDVFLGGVSGLHANEGTGLALVVPVLDPLLRAEAHCEGSGLLAVSHITIVLLEAKDELIVFVPVIDQFVSQW
jgi:hypothetical protein